MIEKEPVVLSWLRRHLPKNAKKCLRAMFNRCLSPAGYRRLRYYWACVSVFFPSTVASAFVKTAPKVRGFGSAEGPDSLTARLGAVKVLARTRLCGIMLRQGSDKSYARHNYTVIYSALFESLRDRPLRIFELGIGSMDDSVPFAMGFYGVPGASHRGWREYFPNAVVFGADIDRACLFEEDRIKTFYCDQLDKAAIADLWANPELEDGVDIIVDDGYHSFEANLAFLEGSLAKLPPGGLHIIEDIASANIDRWHETIANDLAPRYPTHEFAFTQLPHGFNDFDNNMLVVRSPALIEVRQKLTLDGH